MAHDRRQDGTPPSSGRDPWSRDDAPEWRSELPGLPERHESADYTRFGFKELGSPDVMNAYLDGELSRRSPRFRAALVGNRKFRADLAAMEELDAELGRHPQSIDFTDSIMDRLSGSTKFAAASPSRFVTTGRLAAAASVLLALSATVLVSRAIPNLFPHTVTPIEAVVHGGEDRPREDNTHARLAYAGLASPANVPRHQVDSGASRLSSPTSSASAPSPMPLVRGVLVTLGRGVRGSGTFEMRTSRAGLSGTFDHASGSGTADVALSSAGFVSRERLSPERLWSNPESRAWTDASVVADLKAARLPKRADSWSGPTVWAMDLSSAPGWRLVPVDADAGYAFDGITGRRHR